MQQIVQIQEKHVRWVDSDIKDIKPSDDLWHSIRSHVPLLSQSAINIWAPHYSSHFKEVPATRHRSYVYNATDVIGEKQQEGNNGTIC